MPPQAGQWPTSGLRFLICGWGSSSFCTGPDMRLMLSVSVVVSTLVPALGFYVTFCHLPGISLPVFLK